MTLKKKVEVAEYNFLIGAIRLQISKSIKAVSRIFVLALTVYKILKHEIFDLEKSRSRS